LITNFACPYYQTCPQYMSIASANQVCTNITQTYFSQQTIVGMLADQDLCMVNSDCASNNCVAYTCVGFTSGSNCTSSQQCAAGLYCNSTLPPTTAAPGTCVARGGANAACTSTWLGNVQCQNNFMCIGMVCLGQFSMPTNTVLPPAQWAYGSYLCASGYMNPKTWICEDLTSAGTATSPLSCSGMTGTCSYTTSNSSTVITKSCGCSPIGTPVCALGTNTTQYQALSTAALALNNIGCSYYARGGCRLSDSYNGLQAQLMASQASAAFSYPGVNLNSLTCLMPRVIDVNPNANQVVLSPSAPSTSTKPASSSRLSFGLFISGLIGLSLTL